MMMIMSGSEYAGSPLLLWAVPGPIWHIIFCLLLLPPSHQGRRPWRGARLLNRLKNKLRNRGNSSPRASQQGGGEGSSSPGATGTHRSRLLSRLKNKLQNKLQNLGNSAGASQQGGAGNASITEEQQAEALRTFGSCWPLLRCAMVCKRLLYHVASFFVSHHHALPPSPFPLPTTFVLHHVASFSDLEPMTLPINPQDPATLTPPSGTLSVFLRHAPHTPLNLELNSAQEIHCLGRGFEPIIKERHVMNPAFLEEFQQLQRLKLGRGTWQLGTLNPARFWGLRSLSIHDFVCNGNALSFLASLAPHLRELALASSSHVPPFTLDFKLTAARTVTLCFEKQALHLRCALPASLKAFSATAACLNVDCTSSSSPPSLDSLSLIGYSQLLVSSLPLAAAKSVYLNGASTRANRWRVFPSSGDDSQLALTDLLSSIAPTVETLVLRYGWPLEGVRVEWSQLRHLSVGVNRYSTGGFSYNENPEDPEDSQFWKFFGVEEWGSTSGSSNTYIDAPDLESIYYASDEWQPGMPDALRRQFPSLTSCRIVNPAADKEEGLRVVIAVLVVVWPWIGVAMGWGAPVVVHGNPVTMGWRWVLAVWVAMVGIVYGAYTGARTAGAVDNRTADSLDLDCHCEAPLSLDFLMLIGRKRLVVSSLPLASAKDVYLNAPSMHEESVNPLTNPPHSLSDPSHSPQSSPNQPPSSRDLYSPSISESSLIRLLQSVAPTVEELMVPHSLPIEAVEGEWRELHRLAIGVRGSKAGGGRCKTTVEAAEARAGGSRRLYPRHGADGERGDRGSGRGDNGGSSIDGSSSSRRSRNREAPRPPCINAPALRSLLFATRRCNADTLVSLQADFPSLEIYCVVGRSFCWKPIGSERLNVVAHNRESLDVVDLLPGPIWHIIFRHLLLPPTDSTELQNQGNSLAELQEGEGSISSDDTSPLSASEQHEENARCFGSSWPLLRLAMASKRLLHHVISFSVSH
ncbi:unnamed protein product [Closterium sp. NIES-64]|nr:unnamed protein product [Closterium sp. NIES-64]